MADREKVIKGLECCIEKLDTVTNKTHGFNCTACTYFKRCDSSGYLLGLPLMKDALALLKAQEPRDFHNGFIGLSEQAFFNPQPVKPNVIMHGKMVMYYQCPACLRTINPGDKFCRHCGRAVKWE